MKYIKIFVASSVDEFEKYRRELGDYILSLNNIYVKRGIYFEYDICENFSNAVSGKGIRKQDEYNEKIRESEYFYLLFGKKVGSYTEEEFNVALKQFHKTGLPRIYTYFQVMKEGENPEKSVLDFMNRLDQQLGHYYIMFKDIDSIKLNILLELVRNEKLEKSISVEDGKVKVLDKTILGLENIPAYSKNEFLSNLREEKSKLDSRCMELRLKYAENPKDNEIFEEMMSVHRERDKTGERLRQEENEMFRRYKDALKMGCDGVPMTERGKKARRLMEMGDYQGALMILNDFERQKEREQISNLKEMVTLRIRGYIGENRLKILTLHSLKFTEEIAKELEKCYQENVNLAMEYHVDYTCLYEYAVYLNYMHRFSKALEVLEQLEKIYESFQSVSPKEWTELYLLKAELLGWLNEHSLSTFYLIKCIQLADEVEDSDTRATIFNDYAKACMKSHDYRHAEIYFRKALELCKDQQCRDVGIIYGNLGHALKGLYCNGEKVSLEDMREFYWKAYEIEKALQKQEETKDYAKLAEVHLNLADFYFDHDDKMLAENFYTKALELEREAALINPSKYLKSVVQIMRELAFYYDKQRAFPKSEPLYLEALPIIRKLRKNEPGAYGDIYATLCQNYGYYLAENGNFKKSANYYERAIDLYGELISKGNHSYEEIQAMCKESLNRVKRFI